MPRRGGRTAERTLLLAALVATAVAAEPLRAQPAPRRPPTIQIPVRAARPLPPPLNEPNPLPPGQLGLDNIQLNWAVIGASNPAQAVGAGWVQLAAFGAELVEPSAPGAGQIRMPAADGVARISVYLRPHQANVIYAVRCVIDRMNATAVTATFPGTQQTWNFPPGDAPQEIEEVEFFLSYQAIPQDFWAFTLEANSAWNLLGCRFRVV